MSTDFSSELGWVGTLPESWAFTPLGRAAWIRARLGWKGLTADEYVPDGVPLLATPDIKGKVIRYDEANRITSARFDESPEIALRDGDVLLTKDGATLGICNIVRDLPGPATVNGSIAVITPDPGLVGAFLYYVLTSSYSQAIFDRLRGGMGVPHLFQSDINRVRVPLPPMDEQRAIADFLDEQTSRIDALIDKQTQLITTLRERRRALIENATIARPATHRVKHAAEVTLGKMLDQGRAARIGETDRPYVRAADVLNNGTVNLDDLNTMPFSDDEAARLSLRSADVLVIEGGATVGKPGFLPDDVEGIAFQKTINRVRARRGVSDGRFLFLTLSALYESGYYARAYDTVSFVHLTAEKLREVPIPLPPLSEQRAIAAATDARAASIDALIDKTRQHIALAKERRAALITAAVTGQIGVHAAGRAMQGVA